MLTTLLLLLSILPPNVQAFMVVLGKYEEKAEILDDRNNIFEELFET